MKLYLKGSRCYTDKCGIQRRAYPPGQHGLGRHKRTEYGVQLREKQKLKRIYGVLERQLRKTFREAERRTGKTGDNLIQLLEQRLDTFVYRAGFAVSMRDSRQLIRHGHLEVNGRRVDIPSFSLRKGDQVSIREKSRKLLRVLNSVELTSGGRLSWVEVDPKNLNAQLVDWPKREEITIPINDQLIVELYSR
jgi:small subunit ribosomal protein S4